jgi:hypothetical protein
MSCVWKLRNNVLTVNSVVWRNAAISCFKVSDSHILYVFKKYSFAAYDFVNHLLRPQSLLPTVMQTLSTTDIEYLGQTIGTSLKSKVLFCTFTARFRITPLTSNGSVNISFRLCITPRRRHVSYWGGSTTVARIWPWSVTDVKSCRPAFLKLWYAYHQWYTIHCSFSGTRVSKEQSKDKK